MLKHRSATNAFLDYGGKGNKIKRSVFFDQVNVLIDRGINGYIRCFFVKTLHHLFSTDFNAGAIVF